MGTILAARKAALDARVADGTLTQAQADAAYQQVRKVNRGWNRFWQLTRLRLVVQLYFALFIAKVAVEKAIVGEESSTFVPSPEAYSPFGGFEGLYKFATTSGLFIAHTHWSNILDLMLPEISGWEVCRALREELKIPVIMLTARRRCGQDRRSGARRRRLRDQALQPARPIPSSTLTSRSAAGCMLPARPNYWQLTTPSPARGRVSST